MRPAHPHSFHRSLALVEILAVFFALVPALARAQTSPSLVVTPVVIDEKGKARDIINESITLTNASNGPMQIFPSVNDVQDQTGQQPFQYAQNASGLADSLSNWIELSRGEIDLQPGQQRTIPFTITINENALPNTYHAMISFTEGTTRDQADATAPLATVAVNLEVDADIKETMQLDKFTSDNIVFTGDDVLFNYALQNTGNQQLQPTGEIDIYNRSGEEVASVDVNREGKVISPDQTAELASVWSAANGFGQFKALLTINYGSGNGTLQDTVFFWVIPWIQILELLAASFVVILILGLYFQRWLEGRHLTRLHVAGALKPGVFEAIVSTPPPPIIPVPSLPSLPPLPELPSPAEIAEKAQAQVAHKRKLFSLFKRKGFVSVPKPLERNEKTAPPAEARRASAPSSTIDLKQICPGALPQEPQHGHVINLKKNG